MSGGGKGSVTVGYKYYMGLHCGVCHGPVDSLLEIRGGNITLWSGTQSSNGTIAINADTAYGGDKREGGVSGNLDVMMGGSSQAANSYLTSVIGGLQNAYRGLLTLVFNGGHISSNNPYPKPWSFRVRRTTAGWDGGSAWYSAKAAVTLSNGVVGMNPAHIVYEVLTNRDWGMGYSTAIIDTTAFQAAADTLYGEGTGLCILWQRSDTIENFLQQIVDYAGAVLVQSKTTGLFQLNLLRGGYSIGSLPTITRDNIMEVISIEASAVTGATNEVVVNWYDPTIKAKQTVVLQSLGAINAQGAIVSATRDYGGIASADLAARMAQRELRSLSVPLKRVKLKVDRNAYTWLPGGLFVLNFPDEGVNSLVFRVGEVDYGTLAAGSITITAIQDVFSLPAATYVAAQTTGWTPPSTTPTASPYSQAMEATYRELYENMSASDLAGLPTTAGYAMLLASRPSSLAQNFQMWTSVSPAAFAQHGNGDFSPTGVVQSSMNPFDTSITILSGIDLSNVTVPSAALIDNEIVSVTALNVTTGVATIARGCVDTVPATHAAGARIWFYSNNFYGSDRVQYFSGETVQECSLTHMSTGATLPLASAPIYNCAIAGRPSMPYPPANLYVNGTRWDLVTHIPGPTISLTWSERNRVTQQDQLIDNTAGTITPESGTTYTIVIFNGSGDASIYTATGVTGTSWTSPSLTLPATVGIKVTAVRGGISSWQSQVMPAVPSP